MKTKNVICVALGAVVAGAIIENKFGVVNTVKKAAVDGWNSAKKLVVKEELEEDIEDLLEDTVD